MNSITVYKKKIRKEHLAQRNNLDSSIKLVADRLLNEELINYVIQHKAQNIHCYLSIGSEINLKPFINFCLESGRTIIAPQSLKNSILIHKVLQSWESLDKGPMNTYHPSGDNVFQGKYDLIIVPGLAFGLNGHRVGYGMGYYDRFLAQQNDPIKIALCYNFQILSDIPADHYDQKVDFLLFSKKSKVKWHQCHPIISAD